MQNDALRFCKNVQMLDKISIAKMHDSIGLLSLEQRRQKQLLKLMFIHAMKGKSRLVTNVNTRNQTNMFLRLIQKWAKSTKDLLFIWVRDYGTHFINQPKIYLVDMHSKGKLILYTRNTVR